MTSLIFRKPAAAPTTVFGRIWNAVPNMVELTETTMVLGCAAAMTMMLNVML